MRTLLLLLASFSWFNTSQAQIVLGKSSNDITAFYKTFYLPDGAVLKGRVIERFAKDSVVVETRDGLLYYLSNAEAKKAGRNFSRPKSAQADAPANEYIERRVLPAVPVRDEPNFQRGSSQISADLMTHFSSGGAVDDVEPESGIIASLSYLRGVHPQFKVGGGLGIMTIKSGSKERVFPIFARGEYQIRPKISATVSGGYSIIPTNDFVLTSKNGLFGNAGIAFDLVGPESAYTSRIGLGLVMQQLELGRSEIIREGGFGTSRTYTQYVERSGMMRRLQITFTHAWRMSAPEKNKRK